MVRFGYPIIKVMALWLNLENVWMNFYAFFRNIVATVSRSHTKGWPKIFFGDFWTFSVRNVFFYGSERLHTKNISEISIGKKFGKIR
jgi:hypothetical protein